MNIEKLKALAEQLKISNKWYHKIPYIGNRIKIKQQWRKYESIKPELFSTIGEEVDKEVRSKYPDFFAQFVNINDKRLGYSKQFSIKDKNIDKYEKICKGISL
jgi:hypothetical protein